MMTLYLPERHRDLDKVEKGRTARLSFGIILKQAAIAALRSFPVPRKVFFCGAVRAAAWITAIVFLLSAAVPSWAAQPDSDPKRWLSYKTLKGSLRAGNAKTNVSLAQWWEGSVGFRLQGNFVLKQESHDAYFGRVEFKGRIEGSVNYDTGMKGITTEDLKSETAAGCDGTIGPESEVTFSLDYIEGTYTFMVTAPVKCSLNKLTVQPSIGESVDIDMGDEGLFVVSPSADNLIKGFPLPAAGKAFGNSSATMVVPNVGMALPFEGFAEWWIESPPPPREVEVRVAGDACQCNRDVATFTAEATRRGGTFEPFRVEGAEASVNRGGASPLLEMVADASKTPRARITAVYLFEGKRYESPPLEVDFLSVQKPTLSNGFCNAAGMDYLYEGGSLFFAGRSRGWANGAPVKGLQWEIRPGQTAFELESKPGPDSSGGEETVEISRDSLPELNSDFGPRDLFARVSSGNCHCDSEPVRFRTFYYTLDKDNPGGELPNWAYYWRQTKATVPGLDFQVAAALPPPLSKGSWPCSEAWTPVADSPRVQARYELSDDTLYLKDRLPGTDCVPRFPGDAGSSGIDCFAELVRHEGHHKLQLSGWWGQRLERYSCGDDSDGDLVPDDVENTTPGCDPKSSASCPGRPPALGVSDIEFEAYQVGWRWQRGTANGEDWSHPGKNTKCAAPQ